MRNLRMTEVVRPVRYAALAAFLSCLFLANGAFAQANDNLANAEPITGVIGSVTNSSTGATKETGEPNHGGNLGGASIWYEWTAPVNGIVTFTTLGSTVSDTLLGVYKGESYNEIVSVAQNNNVDSQDEGPTLARVKFYANAGTVYKIAVDGAAGASGDVALNWYYYHAGVFRFTRTDYEYSERDNSSPSFAGMQGHRGARLTITREKGYDGAVTVTCQVTNSLDATPTEHTVFFKNYQMAASFTAAMPNDDEELADRITMGAKILSVDFSPVEDVYTNDIVAPSIHSGYKETAIKVLEDDPVGPTIVFERSYMNCNEGMDEALVVVWRVGPLDACSVRYRVDHSGNGNDSYNSFTTRNGSDYATPDASNHLPEPDYSPVEGILNWGQGDASGKVIAIPINNDTTPEFNEDFIVQLWDPSPNALLRSDARTCVVTILADDQPAGAVDKNHLKDYDLGTQRVNNETPGANQTVYGLVVQPDNKTIIGGVFSSFNTFTANRVARMLPNGELDETFNVGGGPNDTVTSLALDSAGRVIVGGAFQSMNSIDRHGVARLTTSGSVDGDFQPGLGANDTVWSVAVLPDDRVLIGGSFTSYDETNRNYIARLNADGKLDTTFDPGVGPDATVFAVVAQPDGKVLIGGDFTMINGFVRNHIARLNADGTVDETFDSNAGVDGTVYSIALQADGKILIGGDFRNVDLRSRSGIARLNVDGSLDTSFDPGTGTDDTVYSIVLQPDGKSIIAGNFTMFNQTRRVGIARLHIDGLLDTSFLDTAYNHFAGIPNPYFNPSYYPRNYIFALGLQEDGNVMIGGGFLKVGGGEVDPRVDPLFDRTERRMMMRTRSNVARLIGNSTTGPGNIHFASDTFSADENNASLFVNLVRTNGNLGQIAASFHPSSRVSGPGAAVFGVDFTFSETYENNRTEFGRIKIPTFPTSFKYSGYNNTWMKSHGVDGRNNIGNTVKANLSYTGSSDDLYITVPTDGSIEGDELANFELMVPQGADIFYLGGENTPLGAALGKTRSTFTVVDKNVRPGTIGFCSPTYTVRLFS